MSGARFEWDPVKARTNQRKHGVSFDEAQSVFWDEAGIEFDDVEHSGEEPRFLLLGLSSRLRLLLVSYCYRSEESTLRILSARKATPLESAHYRRP